MTKQPLRITLIDDDEDCFVIVRDLLADAQGIRTKLTWHDSYEKGLAAIGMNHTDVFLLDYRLGANTGLDLLREARARKIVTPFILLTGQGDQETAVEAMKFGATDYLVKGQIDVSLIERSLRHAVETARNRTLVGHFVDIMESTNDLVSSCDAHGLITYLNRAGRRMLGIGEDEDLSAVPVKQFHPPASAELIASIALPAADRDGHWNGETELLARDGRRIPALQTIIAHKVANGQIEYFSTTCRDITERKRAEESNVRLAAIVESSDDAIIGERLDGIITSWNKGAEKIFGFSAEEMMGTSIMRLIPADRTDDENQIVEKIKRCETVGHFETLRQTKDGRLVDVSVTASPIKDATGKIIGASKILRDITGRRKLEAQFIESQKMEAVGQLAGGVAHDFNNILSVILGYGDLITADLEPDSPLREHAEEIRIAAERAAALTRQLLIFSRKQKVQSFVLDLNGTVKDLDKMLRRLIGENIEITVVPGKEVGRIKADSGYIGQMLMNLAVNARDAMPNGGKLTIATNNVTLDENYALTHIGIIPGDYVMLTVSDTGTGMTKEVKARLFEALFTTKPAGKGTGLGLATCQTIVQQSGGHIDVESEMGKGTTFKIYFPRVDKPLDDAAGPIEAGPLPRGTETLLVVEDEPSVRHVAWKVLETLGYHVLRANNGRDGLHLAREHKGSQIRLVVTDVIMPLMGGKVMADWLKTSYPEIKILFTSGYTDDALAQHGVLEPGVAFLSKPYASATLARKVRTMLDNESDTALLRKQRRTINQPPSGSP